MSPAHVLTYPGNVEHIVGEVKGPCYRSPELLTAVEAHYESAHNNTMVGFVYGVRCEVCFGLITQTNPGVRLDGDPVKTRVRHQQGCLESPGGGS